ncbi:MAG: hypothetical protein ACPGJS_15210 [Flammeovirgaceae bacterium]
MKLDQTSGLVQERLFMLIKSLNKSEKRNVKLYLTRSYRKKDSNIYIKLFDVISQQRVYDEQQLHVHLNKSMSLNKRKLANLKYVLYDLILKSLRILYSDQSIDFKIRVLLDEVEILYHKSLHIQSFKILKKVRKLALEHERFTHIPEIIRWTRLVFTQVADSFDSGKFATLLEENTQVNDYLKQEQELKEVLNQLTFLFREKGKIQNEKDRIHLKVIMTNPILQIDRSQLPFSSKIILHEIYVVYHQLLQDHYNAYLSYQKLIKLWNTEPEKILNAKTHYMSSILNLSITSIILQNNNNGIDSVSIIQQLPTKFTHESIQREAYEKVITLLYQIFNEDSKQALNSTVKNLFNEYQSIMNSLDDFRVKYHICIAYFLTDRPKEALYWGNLLLESRYQSISCYLQDFIRVLSLILHYEMGDLIYLDYLYRSVYRFLKKRPYSPQFELILIKLLKKAFQASSIELPKKVFQDIEQLIIEYTDPIYAHSFEYRCLQAWAKSKLSKNSILHEYQQLIKAKPLLVC